MTLNAHDFDQKATPVNLKVAELFPSFFEPERNPTLPARDASAPEALEQMFAYYEA
ncbi:hypothetical protein [Meridianimarinicoccus aquatilis]|uniref:hypothetical protein n=1 Tax=Meridianimarinicoccus aquatilis TaxID=2552766 RepID=UPI0013DF8E6C|nr:hypothetical protein [Fluviibacterium aquatile]QIE43710.1 hypothetical protein G5B39_16950 [Rhodobacteraceae bacterium SC52]